LAELLARSRPALSQSSSLIIITPAVGGGWVEAMLPLLQRGAVATVLLLDPTTFAAPGDPGGLQALLTNLGVSHHLISRDLLDRPEARPGQWGHWQWRVTPTGRAILRQRPQGLTWKGLGK